MKRKIKAIYSKKHNSLVLNTGRFKFFYIVSTYRKSLFFGDLKYLRLWWTFEFDKLEKVVKAITPSKNMMKLKVEVT